MSGHSKWSTIKHKKGAMDAKRGRIFTKLIKEITVAARGGGDQETNPRLRTAVLRARAANMPKDNIDRAIKKGTGELGSIEFFELTYEGYAPGGVGLLVETLTDNKNRTSSNVKSILSKAGGQLATAGAVGYQFKRMGVIFVSLESIDEEKVMEVALDAGADDILSEEGMLEIRMDPNQFESVIDALQRENIVSENAEITMISDNLVALDKEKAIKVIALIEKLEDDDDVQNVYSNLDIPDDMEL
ncbi:MAG: YebC/PmpR family DNA-binding transcriptional regulator [Spirochaetia bacterium]